MKIKKTVSQKVRDANRKNGQLSPGPKTLAGKNATEPGMKATKAIDNPGVGEISPSELWRGLRHKEEQMSEDAFKRWQTLFANQRFFSYPLFEPPHDASDESVNRFWILALNITFFSYCCEIAEPVRIGCLSLQRGCTWRAFVNQKIC